jgi:hypothetical protein
LRVRLWSVEVGGQFAGEVHGEVDGAVGVGLGWAIDECAVDLLDRFGDLEAPGPAVESPHAKGGDLSRAQAAPGGQADEQTVSGPRLVGMGSGRGRVGDLVGESHHVGRGEEHHFLAHAPGDAEPVGGVPADGIAPQRLARHEAEDLAFLAHSAGGESVA